VFRFWYKPLVSRIGRWWGWGIKQVVLTAKGEQFLAAMTERGRAFLSPIVTELSLKEADEGLRFLQNVTSLLERSLQRSRASVPARAPVASSRSKRRTSRRPSPLFAD
jgi:hypothetical protein